MLSDIEIAMGANMEPIEKVAEKIGIEGEELELRVEMAHELYAPVSIGTFFCTQPFKAVSVARP